MKDRLFSLLKKKVLILDGAMGTMIQKSGVTIEGPPELLNIENPKVIKDIHAGYINAGADIILTNTFGANRIKLSEYGMADRILELNTAAVRIAKECAGTKVLVAASIAPTGKFLEPIGDLDFDTAYDIYKEQATICINAGADILAFESFGDIKELRAAVIAARSVSSTIPILAMMTFQEDIRTVLGTSPEAAAITLASAGADILGANCSLGPELLIEVITRMRSVTSLPFSVQPNAGMPEIRDNLTIYPASPEFMAGYVEKFVEKGVVIIGGCCGTNFSHIKEMAEAAKRLKPLLPSGDLKGTYVSSRSSVVKIGDGSYTKIIGERINPTGKKEFSEDLRGKRVGVAVNMASLQVKDKADLLDINVGAPSVDEPCMMEKIVKAVQAVVSAPLIIDSQDPIVIEAALKSADGKVIINSVNGETKILNSILPLAKKYGAALIGLTLDETGIPKKLETKLTIVEKILKSAELAGITKENIIIDCLTLAVSAEQDQAKETLKAIRVIKERFGLNTVLGVSNISFGMPERWSLNSSFLTMAVSSGLDAAIINPSDQLVCGTLYAADMLTGKDRGGKRYLKRFEGISKLNAVKKDDTKKTDTIEDKISNAIVMGDKESIPQLLEDALSKTIPPADIVDKIFIPSLKHVGELFERKEYFLPQMILSAETIQKGFDILKSRFNAEINKTVKGKVVIATVKGDVHDIGKNIVVTMLKNYGYDVIDMGKSVASDDIIECAVENKADIIGLSALMTTTMGEMELTVKKIKEKGLDISIIVGGAVVTERFAKSIGADAYAKDALEAVKKAEELMRDTIE